MKGDMEGLMKYIKSPRDAGLALFPAIDYKRIDFVKEILKFPGINIDEKDMVILIILYSKNVHL